MRKSGMGGGGSPMGGGGSQSLQQRRSPRTFQSNWTTGGGGLQSPQQGRSPLQSDWAMALEPAVHVPGGPFQPLPEQVVVRPFGESLVRYREGPLDYEPGILCKCGKKMGRFVSWRQFPGRRFYACMDGIHGCRLSQWYDPPFSQFVTNMFGDLRDSVHELRERVQALEEEVDGYKQQQKEIEGTLGDMIKNLSIK